MEIALDLRKNPMLVMWGQKIRSWHEWTKPTAWASLMVPESIANRSALAVGFGVNPMCTDDPPRLLLGFFPQISEAIYLIPRALPTGTAGLPRAENL